MTLQTFTVGTFAQQGVGAAGSYESIATTTVGAGGSASVSFTSIPSTYTHLQIRFISKTTGNDAAGNNLLRINSSSSSSDYVYLHYLLGDGSSAIAGAVTSGTGIYGGRIAANLTGANIFGVGVIDILDYQNTSKYKTFRVLSGFDKNGAGEIALTSGLYLSTSAISSIQILANNGNLAQYSHFALYGIKAA